jgi:hypothetical protein
MKEDTWYARNHEKALENAKKYRNENREKYKTYWKTYYELNKEKLKEKHKEYVRKNKDVINRKNRTIYYKRHQAKKKGLQDVVVEAPVELNPTVEMPMWTMLVSRGDHEVRFD